MPDSQHDPFLIQAESSESDSGSDVEEMSSVKKPTNKKRHKTAPLEMPSNKPVPRFRPIIKGSGRKARDPRFDDLCGEYNPRVFSQAYRFLNEDRENELVTLKKTLKKCKSRQSKTAIQSSIDFLQKSRESDEREARIREQKAEWYRQEKELVNQGKKPFFLKKSELRKMELIDKFKTLQKSGSVDKFIAKRRKRNAAKDHRWLAHE